MEKKSDERKATKIIKILVDSGFESWFVGGCVRDALLDLEPKDFDITTSAKPEEVKKIFNKVIFTDKEADFGRSSVFVDGSEFEVTTFREDGSYSDGRRPDKVVFASAETDARRRDFTVNAIYYNPTNNEIFDPLNGKKDLESRLLRFVGNADERIKEDPLRLLRFVRFMIKGFMPKKETIQAVRDNASLILKVSKERIKDELDKMMKIDPYRTIMNLNACGLLEEILPEVFNLKSVNQNPLWHPEGDVFTHTLLALKSLDKDAKLNVKYAVLFHDIGKLEATTIVDGRISHKGHPKASFEMFNLLSTRLRFSNKEQKNIGEMVKEHDFFIDIKKKRKSTIKRMFMNEHMDFLDLLEVHRADRNGAIGDMSDGEHGLKVYKDYLMNKDKAIPFIMGKDLIDLGLNPSPEFKIILDIVYDAQLNAKVNSKEEALIFLKEVFDIQDSL